MKKTYLVTGGTGFIGSNIVIELVKNGNKVKVFDNNSRGLISRLDGYFDEIEFIEGDIRDQDLVKDITKDIDSVIHLAYINGTEYFYSKPEQVLDVGIRGMLNILDGCRVNRVRELFLASSSEVYQTPPQIPTPEDVPLIVPDLMNPRYSYGGGKIASELLAINFARKNLDRLVIFRPHNIYGPNMGTKHVVPQFILRALNHKTKYSKTKCDFDILGSGEQTRAFCFIEDFVHGVMRIIDEGKHMNVYHIGTEEEVTIKKLASCVLETMNIKYELKFLTQPEGEVDRRCPNVSKLEAIGYSPKYNLIEGVSKTIEWYENNYQGLRDM